MADHKGWHNRNHLPHLDAAGVTQHVIFRLHDSLPTSVLERIKNEAAQSKDLRTAVDDELDRGSGPTWLGDPACAQIVADALMAFDGERYALHAWCIMPNHVHVLIQQAEGWPLDQIVKSWKSFTARVINQRLGRTGAFWASDYFDRFIRNEEQLIGIIRYIEVNPVKAGLCQAPHLWAWSSASMERGPPGPRSSITQVADLEVRAPFSETP